MKLKSLLNRPFDRVKITPLGKLFSVFTLLYGIATINSGNNLLYMILAYLLILMFASGILSTLNILFLSVEPQGQDIIYKNRTANIYVKVSKKKLPAFLIYFCTSHGCKFIPFLMKDRNIVVNLPFKSQKRGIIGIEDLTVYSLFPFGFAKRWRYINIGMKILVLPDIDVHLKERHKFEKSAPGEKYADKRGFEGDFKGLRRYIPGESLLHIHWKKSYKELNLKEFGIMEKDSIIFRLPASAEEVEIDAVATLIHETIRENKSVGLLVEDKFFIPPSVGVSHELNLLKTLALL